MIMPKISVIIPVYGVEKYIERCAVSLFQQTLEDIEYIFIDDCSPDNSVRILQQILDKYPSRKPATRILKMPVNSGSAAVREHGMRVAQGDYIIHCDSDDWVALDMYEKLYKLAISNDYDMVWCDYYRSDGNIHQIIKQECDPDKIKLVSSYLTSRLIASVCNRLYKRVLFNTTEFVYPECNMTEDFVLSLQITLKAQKIAYLAEPLYFYYINNQSICLAPDEKKILSNFKGQLVNSGIIFDKIEMAGFTNTFREEIQCKKCTDKDFLRPLLNKKVYRNLWLQTYPEVNRSFLLTPMVPFSSKVRGFFVLSRLYPFYNIVLNLVRNNGKKKNISDK